MELVVIAVVVVVIGVVVVVVEEMVVVVEEVVVAAVVEQDFFDLQRYPLHQHPCHCFLEIVFGLLMAEDIIRSELGGMVTYD
jgi:hypothetical protein